MTVYCPSSSAGSRTPAGLQAAEECQQLLDRLSDTLLRAIALWKIEGFTTEEIAAKLDCAIADGRAEVAAHPQALESGAHR